MFLSRKAGIRYVDGGDKAAGDYQLGSFTVDDAWHTLDMSAIIGVGVKLVNLFAIVAGTSFADYIEFRTHGNVEEINVALFAIPTGTPQIMDDKWVLTDADGKVDYKAGAVATLVGVDITVRGWLVL